MEPRPAVWSGAPMQQTRGPIDRSPGSVHLGQFGTAAKKLHDFGLKR
jgi:hypothetical protein